MRWLAHSWRAFTRSYTTADYQKWMLSLAATLDFDLDNMFDRGKLFGGEAIYVCPTRNVERTCDVRNNT
ncbi:hypothetical protein FPOAC2_09499 [Fusarium poae]|uniref:hypothetical protein n=1 Tax=Fusarium poae TaxID=36050 RepID=UPI001CEB4944|nr:hypothetical protein FPOAC1_009560 [Fusarium poae]KAG8670156.1 hypothetical protein FPOAC1_009560 [Fusarium poae]